jgi:DNA-directed RNA polymerase specialized sigma subunit
VHGEKISQLAHDAKTCEKSFKELRMKVRRITSKIVNKFATFADRKDLYSMCDISFINSVRTFDKTKGLFEPHYMQRAWQEVKREVLKESAIRIPEAIIMLNRKLSEEDRDLLINTNDHNEVLKLAVKYKTTVRQIVKIRDIKTVIPTADFIIDLCDFEIESEHDLEEDFMKSKISEALEPLPDECVEVIFQYYDMGADTGQATFTKIANNLGMPVDYVKRLYTMGMNYLKRPDVAEQLRDLL